MPIDSIIKVSAIILAAATTNSAASIDIPEDGLILSIGGLITSTGPAAAVGAHRLSGELSFLSTNQFGVNDARGSLAGIASSYELFGVTSGAKTSEMAVINPPDGITVNAGERIHLHTLSSTAALTGSVTFLLYVDNKGGGRRAVRRR